MNMNHHEPSNWTLQNKSDLSRLVGCSVPKVPSIQEYEHIKVDIPNMINVAFPFKSSRWVIPKNHASSSQQQTAGTRWRMALWWAVWPLNLGRCFMIAFSLGDDMVLHESILYDIVWYCMILYDLGLDVWLTLINHWTLASTAKMIQVHQTDWRINW